MGVRSNMLELAILGELYEPLHGYELRKRIAGLLGPVRRLSFGSLYPALHRLDERGLIRVVEVGPAEGRRSKWSGKTARSDSTLPRRKQVIYQTTEAGRTHLKNALADADVGDESMDLTVSLMSRATPAIRMGLMKRRRSLVEQRRDAAERAKLSSDFWIRSRGELESEQAFTELAWIDRMIQRDPDLQGRPIEATSMTEKGQ